VDSEQALALKEGTMVWVTPGMDEEGMPWRPRRDNGLPNPIPKAEAWPVRNTHRTSDTHDVEIYFNSHRDGQGTYWYDRDVFLTQIEAENKIIRQLQDSLASEEDHLDQLREKLKEREGDWVEKMRALANPEPEKWWWREEMKYKDPEGYDGLPIHQVFRTRFLRTELDLIGKICPICSKALKKGESFTLHHMTNETPAVEVHTLCSGYYEEDRRKCHWCDKVIPWELFENHEVPIQAFTGRCFHPEDCWEDYRDAEGV
jgi:hypothetical protein